MKETLESRETEQQEAHDKATSILTEKGFTTIKAFQIRNLFIKASGLREEYPFIENTTHKGEKGWFKSEYKEITHFLFKTEEEVILANAIYLNTKVEGESFNTGTFWQNVRYTFRLLGVKNEWSEL